MGEPIAVFVQCAGGKRDSKSPVWSLYSTTPFEKRWTAAQLLGDPFVASAEHGLVFPNERIEPYDTNLKKDLTEEERIAWGKEIVSDIPDHYDTLILLSGKRYSNPIETGIHSVPDNTLRTVIRPFDEAGCSGIGEQMSWCGTASEMVLDGATTWDVLRETT